MIPVIHMMRWNIPSISWANVEACSGKCIQNGSAPAEAGASAAPKRKSAVRRSRPARGTVVVIFTIAESTELSLEVEVHGFGFAPADRHVLRLGAVLLVPGLDDVVAGRQVLDLEDALIVGHREERVVEDARVGAHPLVNVALEAHRGLGAVELLDRFHALEGLADVELAVLLGERMDVVQGSVAVEDLQRLPRLDAEHVRPVLTTMLVQGHRLGRRRVVAGDA